MKRRRLIQVKAEEPGNDEEYRYEQNWARASPPYSTPTPKEPECSLAGLGN